MPASSTGFFRSRLRRPGLIVAAAAVVVLGGAGVTYTFARTGEPSSPKTPTVKIWGDQEVPGLTAANSTCWGLQFKHDWFIFAQLKYSADQEALLVDQKSRADIESYYNHPIDTGVRGSTYDLSWMTDYLGHDFPDGYFVYGAQVCVMRVLGAPPETFETMMETTAWDGEQSVTWPGYRATWNNDGDSGPDVIFTYERP